ncbi:hypothetical protein J1614_003463 [Plenodomus biglobosus]|nr:hypothetical protein J1614_003463 [Plenodomus biglobosus]
MTPWCLATQEPFQVRESCKRSVAGEEAQANTTHTIAIRALTRSDNANPVDVVPKGPTGVKTAHGDVNEVDATAKRPDCEVLDPSSHAEPQLSFLYDTERIDPCAKNNILMRSLIAPMPGLHFGSTVTLVDDEAFSMANLLDALPEVGRDSDGDLNMKTSDEAMDDVEMMEQAVNPDKDWGDVMIL